MVTLSPAYRITIKVGEKLFAGHVDNSLAIVPNYDPILRKSLGGRFDLDFVSVDLDMQVSGLTYERTVTEEATHNDFADLRAACSNPVSVAFVYGDMTPGKIVLAGNAKLSDYQERAGSGKICGTWSCRLRSIRGTVQEEVVPPAVQDVKYGLLYNWYAATDARNISAAGSHIPSKSDIDSLIAYVGSGDFGDDMKEGGTEYWNHANGENLYGFNMRGSGARNNSTGVFQNLKGEALLWSTAIPFYPLALQFRDTTNYQFVQFLQRWGFSVRPIMDSTSLSHGQSGVYVGNDGRAYRTICIGTQEWLADNLAETKFRTGEAIPEVTDNAAWAALTTAGMCAYNNDWTNV